MANFAKIFKTMSLKEKGFSIIEASIAAAITMGSIVVAYNEMGGSSDDGLSRPSDKDNQSAVISIVKKAFKKNNPYLDACPDINALSSLSSGAFNTNDSEIVNFQGGTFGQALTSLGNELCSESNFCFVRKLYQRKANQQKFITAETLFALTPVMVALDGSTAAFCNTSQLSSGPRAPGIHWRVANATPSSNKTPTVSEGIIKGVIPKDASILSGLTSGTGYSHTHYWIHWMIRYATFDQRTPGVPLLYHHKVYSYQRYALRRRITTVYAKLWWTYGCTLDDLYANKQDCRCVLGDYNPAIANSRGFTPPSMCIGADPYGEYYEKGPGWLDEYRN